MMTKQVEKLIPSSLKGPARSLYRGSRSYWEFFAEDLRDKVGGAAGRYAPFILPPARLRFQVHVAVDAASFVRTAKLDAELIVNTLKQQQRRLDECANILDWGCGPGKVLQALYLDHLQKMVPNRRPKLFGSDISNDTIKWASRNLPFANFSVNSPQPPLKYEADYFDLIYGISVFSHLDKELEGAWLRELYRLIRSDGIVIVSVRGTHATSIAVKPGSAEYQQLHTEGIVFRTPPTGYRKEGLPDCYGNTYHTKEYILKRYSQNFEILDHVERGLLGGQDLLVLKKRNGQKVDASQRESGEAERIPSVA